MVSHGEGQFPRPQGRGAGLTVFLAGFGGSLLLLTLEYLTAGDAPGWFILVPTNPTTLLAALVAHRVEPMFGSRWSDETFFGTLLAESALWWWTVGAVVDTIRRRRALTARRSSRPT